MSDKTVIENWIDNHRELLLLTIILPIGKILTIRDRFIERLNHPDPADHKNRIERVVDDIRQFNKLRKPLRTHR